MSSLRDWLKDTIGGANGDEGDNKKEPEEHKEVEEEEEEEEEEKGLSPAELRKLRMQRFPMSTSSPPVKSPPLKKSKPASPKKKAPAPQLVAPAPSTPPSGGLRSGGASPAASSPLDILLAEDEDAWLHQQLQFVFELGEEHLAAIEVEDGALLDLTRLDEVVLVAGVRRSADVLRFLFEAYCRCSTMSEKQLNKRVPMRMQALSQIKRVTCAYAGLAITMPSLFEAKADPEHLIALVTMDASEALYFRSQTFVNDLISAARDKARDIFEPVLTLLCSRVTPASVMDSDLSRHYRVLGTLLGNAHLGPLVHELPSWLPDGNGRQLEQASVLGPYFSPSSFHNDPAAGDALFSNASQRSRDDLRSSMELLRTRLTSVSTSLHQVLLGMLRNKVRREHVLRWLRAAIERNAPRALMRYDGNTVSSDGFMLNLGSVMARLSAPFYGKPEKVGAGYAPRLGQFTLLNSEKAGAPASGDEEASFVTECFWLTARCLGIGFQVAVRNYERVYRAFVEVRQRLDNLPPHAGPDVRQKLAYQRALIEKDLLADQAHCRNPTVMALASDFYDFVAAWLVHLARRSTTEVICALPEWLIEDLCNFYLLLGRHESQTLRSCRLQDVLTFVTLYLSSPYIHNPYLRSQLCNVLGLLVPGEDKDVPVGLFQDNAEASRILAPALMDLYVDIERTGRAGQYYEKFSIRYNISQVLEYLWTQPNYHASMLSECHTSDKFKAFVTLLSNDAIYLLDESIEKLHKMHEFEELPEEEKEAQREEYSRMQGSVRSYLLLGNATISMFLYLSCDVVEPFMQAELVSRLANFLDYFLIAFAGPRSAELKVRNPEKYNFSPRHILSSLCQIYVNFSGSQDFINAIVKDERSYKHEIFLDAAKILRRIGGVSEDTILKFESFLMSLEEASSQEEKMEELLADPPDEFLDPLLYTLMRDPVRMPVSGVSIDRLTISRHLLSDPRDPFSNQPLTLEDLVPDEELKAKIDAWIAEKTGK